MRAREGVALVAAVVACACGSGGSAAAGGPAWWLGEAGAARVVVVDASGAAGIVAAPPALDAPVRALAPRADGAIVVLQEPAGGAPPGVVLSREGVRLAALAAADADGAALFEPGAPPWAAAEAADGRLWVTGREAPVRYERDGALAGRAAALPYPSRGVAALPDGRVLVTFGAHAAAVYAPGGASFALLDVGALGAGAPVPYAGLDAVAARPDGTVLVAVLRHGITAEGVVLAARLEEGALVGIGDPEAAPRLRTLPSALAIAPDGIVAGPSLGAVAAPACAAALAPDLSSVRGCLAAGAHRGVARVR